MSTDDVSPDSVPTRVAKDQEPRANDENGEDSVTEEDSESVTESDSYGSLVEKSTRKAAKMLTDNVCSYSSCCILLLMMLSMRMRQVERIARLQKIVKIASPSQT